MAMMFAASEAPSDKTNQNHGRTVGFFSAWRSLTFRYAATLSRSTDSG